MIAAIRQATSLNYSCVKYKTGHQQSLCKISQKLAQLQLIIYHHEKCKKLSN